MNHLNPNLNSEVLTRVRVIYQLRRLSSPLVVKTACLAGLAGATILQVSVLNVIANSPSPVNPGAMYSFAYSAFSNTGWAVRLTVFGLMFIVGWLLGDAYRNFNLRGLVRYPRRLSLNSFNLFRF